MTIINSITEYKTAWRAKPNKNKKEWGWEISWPAMSTIGGKILRIDAGKSTSFKYYTNKNETLYIMNGLVEIKYGDELFQSDPVQHPIKTELFKEGEAINIQSSCPYQITAIEYSEVLEIGDNSRSNSVKV
jgi:hypothetical protein